MPRIEDLVTSIQDMSYEEQIEHIRRIREGRVVPVERDQTKKAKKSARKKKSLLDIVKDMTPEEKAILLSKIGKG